MLANENNNNCFSQEHQQCIDFDNPEFPEATFKGANHVQGLTRQLMTAMNSNMIQTPGEQCAVTAQDINEYHKAQMGLYSTSPSRFYQVRCVKVAARRCRTPGEASFYTKFGRTSSINRIPLRKFAGYCNATPTNAEGPTVAAACKARPASAATNTSVNAPTACQHAQRLAALSPIPRKWGSMSQPMMVQQQSSDNQTMLFYDGETDGNESDFSHPDSGQAYSRMMPMPPNPMSDSEEGDHCLDGSSALTNFCPNMEQPVYFRVEPYYSGEENWMSRCSEMNRDVQSGMKDPGYSWTNPGDFRPGTTANHANGTSAHEERNHQRMLLVRQNGNEATVSNVILEEDPPDSSISGPTQPKSARIQNISQNYGTETQPWENSSSNNNGHFRSSRKAEAGKYVNPNSDLRWEAGSANMTDTGGNSSGNAMGGSLLVKRRGMLETKNVHFQPLPESRNDGVTTEGDSCPGNGQSNHHPLDNVKTSSLKFPKQGNLKQSSGHFLSKPLNGDENPFHCFPNPQFLPKKSPLEMNSKSTYVHPKVDGTHNCFWHSNKNPQEPSSSREQFNAKLLAQTINPAQFHCLAHSFDTNNYKSPMQARSGFCLDTPNNQHFSQQSNNFDASAMQFPASKEINGMKGVHFQDSSSHNTFFTGDRLQNFVDGNSNPLGSMDVYNFPPNTGCDFQDVSHGFHQFENTGIQGDGTMPDRN